MTESETPTKIKGKWQQNAGFYGKHCGQDAVKIGPNVFVIKDGFVGSANGGKSNANIVGIYRIDPKKPATLERVYNPSYRY
jgi:hypothetical protein